MGQRQVVFDDEGGAAVETVLGLSMTSTGVGWVLLDGLDADGSTLDHDAFDVKTDVAIDGDISKHEAAVRGAQSIATASGHQVKSIGVTWTDDVDGQATLLLKSLPDLGFDNVVEVRLSQATREWARAFGPILEFKKCAVCIIESAAVTVLTVGDGPVQMSATQMRESADGLSRWLTDVFERNGWQPESLFLVGSRGDLELISGSLEEALPMPVIASDDAQLALARGAALALPIGTDVADEQAPQQPVDDAPAHRRLRFGPHARAATVLVAGVITLFAVGPWLAGHNESRPTENRPAANSSATSDSPTTSASVHAVRSPAAPPPPVAVRPLAAEPRPAPPPPEALPPSVAVPSPEPDLGNDPAEAAPVVAPQAPVAPQPVVAPQAPVAPQPVVGPPQPVAPQAVLAAEQPAAPQPVLAPPQPLAPQPVPAPQAPLAPPPGAPNPAPPPPPDPIAVVLSPFFGALP